MPHSPDSEAGRQRLALIQQLWNELRAQPEGSPLYEALVKLIRLETDAYRQTFDSTTATVIRCPLCHSHEVDVVAKTTTPAIRLCKCLKCSTSFTITTPPIN